MFGIFKFNEDTRNHECIRLSDASVSTDGIDTRTYSRTACDFCRLKKLRCSGEKKSCDRCQATSTPCTYTLTSGAGPGKKRHRLTSDPDLGVGCFRVAEPRESGIAADEGRAVGDGRRQEEEAKGTGVGKDTVAFPTQGNRNSSIISSAKPGLWPDTEFELSNTLAFSDASEIDLFGANDALDLSKGFWDASPLQNYDYLTRENIARARARAEEKMPSSPDDSGINLDKFPTRRESRVDFPANERRNYADIGSASSSSLSYSIGCGCLPSMAQLLETVAQQTSNSQKQPIDTLFIGLEDSIAGCRKLLSCTECTACSDNSILLATVGARLGDAWDALATRFLQCQESSQSDGSKDSSEQQWEPRLDPHGSSGTFRYGRYSVQCPLMKSQLLSNLVQLHFQSLNELLMALKAAVRHKESALEIVVGAITKVEAISWAMRKEVGRRRVDVQPLSAKNAS
ncbi:hypothetical protein ANO14919_053270 [Xylariales sp. No.14919]|nr:hypothetical protein ANO14919_053270 [Xylariales sp. No.14919]